MLGAPPPPPAVKTFHPSIAFPAGPVPVGFDVRRGVEHGYTANPWVYRCTTMTAEAVATVPFRARRKDAKGRWQWDEGHDLSGVLADWSDRFGPEESKVLVTTWLLIGGNGLIGKFPGGYRVRSLIPENPAGVEPVLDAVGDVAAYRYSDATRAARYWDAADIVHARLPDPANPYWGLSRLVAMAREVDTDVLAVRWNKRRIELGGIPDGILVDRTITTAEQRADAQRDVDETWRNASGPIVQGEGVEWVRLGLSQNDLQWLEGRRFALRVICQVFGYHPALFGEDATYSNTEQAQRDKWVGGVIPVLNILAGALTRGLIPRNRRADLQIWYDVEHVHALRENLKDQVEVFAKLVATGVPIDSAADVAGLVLDKLPDGLGTHPLVSAQLELLENVVRGQLGGEAGDVFGQFARGEGAEDEGSVDGEGEGTSDGETDGEGADVDVDTIPVPGEDLKGALGRLVRLAERAERFRPSSPTPPARLRAAG